MMKPAKVKTQKVMSSQKFKGMTTMHGSKKVSSKKSGSKKSCNCGH